MISAYFSLKVFLFIEAGFTAFLVLVLLAIRPYFRSQAFFRHWTWAWMAHSVTLVLGIWLTSAGRAPAPLRSFAVLAYAILGMVFAPLLVAGVEAFRKSGADARVARVGALAALPAALLIYILSMAVGIGSPLGLAVRTIPREIVASAALWYCAYVFWGSWRRTASAGSLLAMLACSGHGIARTFFALSAFAGSASSIGWLALDTVCQGGVAVATLLLILEQQAQAESAALQELSESERRYRLLFERNLAGVFRSRIDGTLIDCNEAFCRLHGYGSLEEFRKLNLSSLYVDLEERRSFVAALLASGQVINHQVRVRRRDGSEMIALVNATLVAEPSEESPELQGTVLDVSEVRQLQEHLLQAQKMEAIGSLAGGIAHDFNNILMVISAYCERLAEELSDPAQRAQVETVLQTCWKAADLTKQLLAFSRKQPISLQVLDLNAVVREVSGMLRRLIDENIELHFELEEDLHPCRADATHMHQILMNLAANARDAMPRGGRLWIQTSSAHLNAEQAARLAPLPPGGYVVLAVTDSGTGIDPAIRSRIFEPFFTTKERGKGTGLGLSTVYGIVKQNQGFIFVESERGRGTTFRIYLPQSQDAVSSAAPPSIKAAPPATATVLLVEDELVLRDAGAEYLRARGYKVFTASNGEDAVALVRGTSVQIDVLVTDVMMPGMTGPDLAQVACALRPNLRVLYMSGYPAESPVFGGIDCNPGAYLQKPFSFHTLREKLEELSQSAADAVLR